MTVRVQVAIPLKLADVGADTIVNTWYCRVISPTDAATAAASFKAALQTFYQAIDAEMSNLLIDTPATVKAYDLDDPEPRTPIYESTIALTAVSSAPLPPELAVCLSFRGTYVSGQPKGRYRGRVYIGGFANSGATLESPGRVGSTLTDEIRDAAAALLTTSQASTEFAWVVYSPTDDADRLVVGGWVDNAWDVQRRRGLELTNRDAFGAGH